MNNIFGGATRIPPLPPHREVRRGSTSSYIERDIDIGRGRDTGTPQTYDIDTDFYVTPPALYNMDIDYFKLFFILFIIAMLVLLVVIIITSIPSINNLQIINEYNSNVQNNICNIVDYTSDDSWINKLSTLPNVLNCMNIANELLNYNNFTMTFTIHPQNISNLKYKGIGMFLSNKSDKDSKLSEDLLEILPTIDLSNNEIIVYQRGTKEDRNRGIKENKLVIPFDNKPLNISIKYTGNNFRDDNINISVINSKNIPVELKYRFCVSPYTYINNQTKLIIANYGTSIMNLKLNF